MTFFHPKPEQVQSLWFPLVKKFYQEHYPSGKPNKADPIWVIRNNGKVMCALRLKQIAPELQLLTGMVTAPEYRHSGLGSHLIRNIHPALSQRLTYCFAFTYLVPFYSANGFEVIDSDTLPNELKSRFSAYSLQGRKLTAMRYWAPTQA